MQFKRSFLEVKKYGKQVKINYNISNLQQFVDAFSLSIITGISPITYYQYQLFHPTRRAKRWEFLDDSGKLLQVLAQRLSKCPDDIIFTNKAAFSFWCNLRGLEKVDDCILVSPVPTETVWKSFPLIDLISKPTSERAGKGIEIHFYRIDSDNNPLWEGADGVIRSTKELQMYLQKQSFENGYSIIVQPRLLNHQKIRLMGNGYLSTIRIVTVRDKQMRHAEPLAMVLRIPIGNTIVDNFDQGSLACAIDLDTGKCGCAIQKKGIYSLRLLDSNPETGVAIEGQVLPFWNEAIHLSLSAHEQLNSALPIIGWDIAVLEDGPVLIEANHLPGERLMQMPSGMPLGNTIYPMVLCRSLQNAFSGS